jgi:photosystem II stability/assembly factor-like uncharacterized protein
MRISNFIICFLLGVSLVFSQNGWKVVQGPQVPEIYNRDNTFFLNENEGWIVGSVGASTANYILHTTDKCQNWSIQSYIPAGSDTVWYDVFFVNNMIGWVVGANGIIWKTIDGGLHWISQTPGITSVNIQAVYAVDTLNVYVSGDDGVILKTIDGGSNWMLQAADSITSDLDDIFAWNADSAFCISGNNDGVILYTNDGGANWNQTTVPFPGGTVSQRQYACYGLGDGIGYSAGYHGTVFKTVDYGTSWTNVANILGPLFKIFWCITAFNNQIWTADSDGKIYHSSDAGASWDTLNFVSASNITSLQVFNEQHIYALAEYGQLIESIDGGQTFTPLLSWPNIPFVDMVAAGNKIFSVSNSGGELTFSQDGGVNWSYPVKPNPQVWGGLRSLFFIDDNIGFFAGDDGMIGKTIDGGQTWEMKPTSYGFGSNKRYNFIYFKDSVNGFAGGSSGVIQFTTDGGETWTEGSIGSSIELNDCIFLNTNSGIMAAKSGKIFRSADGGSSWAEVVDMGAVSMEDISFLNSDTGFICAANGYVYQTNDAGENWTEVTQLMNDNTPGVSPDLYRIHFIDDATGYICGEAGAFYKSTDGGLTWNQQILPSSAAEVTFQAMAWKDEIDGFIAGQNGYILGMTPNNIIIPEPVISGYQLYQNYPNPFNPKTKIRFEIPQTGKATLTIYNTLGQVIKKLFEGKLSVGTYTFNWNGINDLGLSSPSGIYFYELKINSFSEIKKMTLVR